MSLTHDLKIILILHPFLLLDIRQHDHKMMQFMKYLKRNQKAFPKIQELIQEQMFYKLRTAYNKMGINIRGRLLARTDLEINNNNSNNNNNNK